MSQTNPQNGIHLQNLCVLVLFNSFNRTKELNTDSKYVMKLTSAPSSSIQIYSSK